MTPAEWQEIVVETDKRWPGQWTPSQAVAFFGDLREFDAVDVWSAWHALNDSGREFPPNGSLLRSRSIDERRTSAKRELWDNPKPALPEPTRHLSEVVPEGLWAEAVAMHRSFKRDTPGAFTPYQLSVNVPSEKWPLVCLSPLCSEKEHG